MHFRVGDSTVTGQSNVMSLRGDGNVGIGTITPAALLHVGNTNTSQFIVGKNPNSGVAADNGMLIQSWSDGNMYVDTKVGNNGSTTFRTGHNTEAAAARTWLTVAGSTGIAYFDKRAHLGNAGTDYNASAYDWNGNLVLDALNTSSILFHDAGYTVGALKFNGSTGFKIGADAGWGQRSVAASAGTDNGDNTIDFLNANFLTTDANCSSALTLANIQDGGTYTLVVTSDTTNQCNFTTTGLTQGWRPTNAARPATKDTVYTFLRIGSVIYISWASFNNPI